MRLSAGRGSYQRQLAQSSQGIIRVLTRFRSRLSKRNTTIKEGSHAHDRRTTPVTPFSYGRHRHLGGSPVHLAWTIRGGDRHCPHDGESGGGGQDRNPPL